MQQDSELTARPSAGATKERSRGERWRALPWRDIVALGGAMLLLTALSVYRLGALSLWRDEISSVVFASAPLSSLVEVLDRDRTEVGLANMGTYYAILHFWLAVGETEARIRFLSVIAGVATLVPVWLIARRIGGWWAALFAAFFFAGSRIVIQWNQEARGYSMAMLVSAGLTWLLLRATDRQQVRWWLAYGLVGALGLYVHFFVGLVIAAHGLWVLATRTWPRRWPALLAVLLPLTVAGVPIPITALAQSTAVRWINPITLESAWGTVWRLAGTEWLMVVVAGLIVLVVIAHGRRPERRVVLLVLAGVLVPVVGAAVLSVIRPMFIPRYLVVVIPSMAILVGAGLAALRPVPLRAVVAVGVAVLLALNLPSAYRDRHQEDWRAAARWISGEVQTDDRIMFHDARRQVVYYLTRFDAHVPAETSIGTAASTAEGRLWVVMRRLSRVEREELRERLSPSYEMVEERAFGRLRLMLLEPTAEAASVGSGPPP